MKNKKELQYDNDQSSSMMDYEIEAAAVDSSVHSDEDGHDHSSPNGNDRKFYILAVISFVLLILGISFTYWEVSFFNGWVKMVWYIIAYIPVGLSVIREAISTLIKGEIFTEFFLMSIATIGAFIIGEYPEGVAVMLFYAVGELFQNAAVSRAKDNIKALLDVRPKFASVLRGDSFIQVGPSDVEVDEIIQIKVGEKVPLDGVLLSGKASFNTSALTGESKPQSVFKGEDVLAGSINMDGVIEMKTTKLFKDSSVSRILEMVQNAISKKAKTELLIRKLAKIYTPIVVYLALVVCFLPYFIVDDYDLKDWFYRALIFLVISCPCALVISIPLGYFGGLGAASKNGVLFKGATYMDKLKDVNTMVMDKTGTVTKGVFRIKQIEIFGSYSQEEFMTYLLSIESKSTHPIAKAIIEYPVTGPVPEANEIKEIAGKGLQGVVTESKVIVGNKKLMDQFNIVIPQEVDRIVESIVLVSINDEFAGYVTIADEMKEDAKETIAAFKKEGIDLLMMLSGDKDRITQKIAKELGISKAKGGLLPEDKLYEIELLKQDETRIIAFMGDGINDAPVLAASDVGIAMGAMGSDVAIETADMIIQTDQPSKVITGIRIAKSTQKVIWQNIFLAFSVKIIVLILGVGGLATMWEAVFADVGVALLAILNAVRLQKMKWN